MRAMKTSLKISLGIIALALIAGVVCLVWLASRPDDPIAANVWTRLPRPVVRCDRREASHRSGLLGILPTKLEAKLFGVGELRFDQASNGAKFGSVGHDRIELSADGWDLLIQTDGEGKVAPGTRLVFPMEIAEHQYTLRCRPADCPTGFLETKTRTGSDVLDGRFVIELAKCEDAKTGRFSIRKPAVIRARRGRQHRSLSAVASRACHRTVLRKMFTHFTSLGVIILQSWSSIWRTDLVSVFSRDLR